MKEPCSGAWFAVRKQPDPTLTGMWWPITGGGRRRRTWDSCAHCLSIPGAVTPRETAAQWWRGRGTDATSLPLPWCLPTALLSCVLTAVISCAWLPCHQPSQSSSRHFLYSRTVMAVSTSPRSKGAWLSLTNIFSVLILSWHFCQRLGKAFAAVFFLPSPHLCPLPQKQKAASNVLKKRMFAELCS